MSRPPLRPEQRKQREHGTNACYRWGVVGQDWRNGCRCFECSNAGNLYEKRRAYKKSKGWEPFVSNAEAREHLLWLQSKNVGLRTVAEVSGLSRSALSLVRSGKRTKSTPEFIAKVLAVGTHQVAAGAFVDAGPTRRLIEELVALGYSKASIAKALGAASPALQIAERDSVLRSTADKVAALHREWTASRDATRHFNAARRRHLRQRIAQGAS